MDIRFHSMPKGASRTECVIIPTFANTCASFAERFAGTPLSWVADSVALADHGAKKGEITVCHGPASALLPRAVLCGLGCKGDLTLERYRTAMAAGARQCRNLRVSRMGVFAEDVTICAEVLGKPRQNVLREALLAILLSTYSCTEYFSAEAKTKGRKENDPAFFVPDSLTILHPGISVPAAMRVPVRLAEAEAAGIALARDLVNAPANVMTPARMAEEAMALAKRYGFGCRALHKKEMVKMGMGGILAVNEGSHKDPRFIILEYNPRDGKRRAPLVLVGKGICFDSGGISLKPAQGMHAMKGDMAGAAAVLGAFEAIGRYAEGMQQPVIGLIPCTENMPGGAALRPGDVITTMAGKTVEVLNTDAEGRLILCDALTYAQKDAAPLAVVDIATLTGACMVALGKGACGLFTEDETLRNSIMSIGNEAGDTIWPMPLWDNLREGLKSDVADMANVGPREGGAIFAALFLQSFVESGVRWAHLDMAGAGITDKASPLCPKGATGFGVRTLYGLARKASEKMFKPN